MDFTREPIIETVVTPKEGCKLVVRNSKNAGQEEYFVDAVEVVSFGNSVFLRSTERPKAFLVPASDYELLEVREARMVLKNVGIERAIKIGGGKAAKEQASDKLEPILPPEIATNVISQEPSAEKPDGRLDKKRDKRRSRRRRGGRDELTSEENESEVKEEAVAGMTPPHSEAKEESDVILTAAPFVSPLLPPPSTLISESIARYRDNALFKGAFYEKTEEGVKEEEAVEFPSSEEQQAPTQQHKEDLLEALAMQDISLEPSEYGSLGFTEDQESGWSLPDLETENHEKH